MNRPLVALGIGAWIALACGLPAAPSAQTPAAPSFEVASVRLHTSDDPRTMMVAQPGGRFLAVNMPLRTIIRAAFRLQDDQIVGGRGGLLFSAAAARAPRSAAPLLRLRVASRAARRQAVAGAVSRTAERARTASTA